MLSIAPDRKALVTGAVQIVRQAGIAPLAKGNAGELLGRLDALDQHGHAIERELRNEIGAERHHDVVGKIEGGKRRERQTRRAVEPIAPASSRPGSSGR